MALFPTKSDWDRFSEQEELHRDRDWKIIGEDAGSGREFWVCAGCNLNTVHLHFKQPEPKEAI